VCQETGGDNRGYNDNAGQDDATKRDLRAAEVSDRKGKYPIDGIKRHDYEKPDLNLHGVIEIPGQLDMIWTTLTSGAESIPKLTLADTLLDGQTQMAGIFIFIHRESNDA